MSDNPWGEPVNIDEDETTFWREQRAVADQYAAEPDRTEWFTNTREQANKVICRDCKRGVGETCVIADHGPELKRFPAHVRRIHDARKRYQ